jgi:hypothetical protein
VNKRKRSWTILTMPFKRCHICGRVFYGIYFCRNRQTTDGLSYECRSCRSEYVRAYREAHPEKYREYDRKWKSRNPEKVKTIRKRWAEKNRDHLRRWKQEWYRLNSDRVAEYARRWRDANPGKRVAQYMARRTVPPEFVCEMCGAEGPTHRHHEDYLEPAKVIPLCPACHQRIHSYHRQYGTNPPDPIVDLGLTAGQLRGLMEENNIEKEEL